MDVKELRIDTGLVTNINDESIKYARNGEMPNNNREKTYTEIGAPSKSDPQATRPCAIIGPDRVLPPANSSDVYIKPTQVDPWPWPDTYRHSYDPIKMTEYHPSRNISPRQTFQENMQRVMVPPTYSSIKNSDDTSLKNNKLNMPPDGKYCDVPYSIKTLASEHKSARNSDNTMVSINPTFSRGASVHGWHPGVGIRPVRPYPAPDYYQYPEYSNCAGPRGMPIIQPQRIVSEESPPAYSERVYQESSVRYKPYPSVKERYPQSRYEFVGANAFHPPSQYPLTKFDLQKSMHTNPYPMYPQAPMKYIDSRYPESMVEGYQKLQNPDLNTFRNQSIPPPYGPIPGNSYQNKAYPSPVDTNKSIHLNKLPYDSNNKVYLDLENSRVKGYPCPDNFYYNNRGPLFRGDIYLPGHPQMNSIPQHPVYRKDSSPPKNFDYISHYRHKDVHTNMSNRHSRFPIQFSPNAIPISPCDSNTSIDTQMLGISQEDCGYASQSSTTSVKSLDSNSGPVGSDYYKRSMYSLHAPSTKNSHRGNLRSKPDNSLEKKGLNLRQFLQMWNEGDEEDSEVNKEVTSNTSAITPSNLSLKPNNNNSQEQLYVLGLVNVPNEELSKYEHLQTISKLPENIKGYNNIEILNQYEQLVELPHAKPNYPIKQSPLRDYKMPLKSYPIKPNTEQSVRPISPLDVEAKISQSVIHKDVGCNFEIKPCSPKVLNVDDATPVHDIIRERLIEKVANPVLMNLNRVNDCKIDNSPDTSRKITSCKMVDSTYSSNNNTAAVKPIYPLQDLESNMSVCLASLPQLDNDIELNLPEVNQQFINANKIGVEPKSKDLGNNHQNNFRNDETVEDLQHTDSFSQLASTGSDKETLKLSKYRKSKKLDNQSNDLLLNNLSVAQRTDSVIIKNPENNKIHRDIYSCFDIESNSNVTNKNVQNEIKVSELFNNPFYTNNLEETAIDFSLSKNETDLLHNRAKSEDNVSEIKENEPQPACPSILPEQSDDCLKTINDPLFAISNNETKEEKRFADDNETKRSDSPLVNGQTTKDDSSPHQTVEDNLIKSCEEKLELKKNAEEFLNTLRDTNSPNDLSTKLLSETQNEILNEIHYNNKNSNEVCNKMDSGEMQEVKDNIEKKGADNIEDHLLNNDENVTNLDTQDDDDMLLETAHQHEVSNCTNDILSEPHNGNHHDKNDNSCQEIVTGHTQNIECKLVDKLPDLTNEDFEAIDIYSPLNDVSNNEDDMHNVSNRPTSPINGKNNLDVVTNCINESLENAIFGITDLPCTKTKDESKESNVICNSQSDYIIFKSSDGHVDENLHISHKSPEIYYNNVSELILSENTSQNNEEIVLINNKEESQMYSTFRNQNSVSSAILKNHVHMKELFSPWIQKLIMYEEGICSTLKCQNQNESLIAKKIISVNNGENLEDLKQSSCENHESTNHFLSKDEVEKNEIGVISSKSHQSESPIVDENGEISIEDLCSAPGIVPEEIVEFDLTDSQNDNQNLTAKHKEISLILKDNTKLLRRTNKRSLSDSAVERHFNDKDEKYLFSKRPKYQDHCHQSSMFSTNLSNIIETHRRNSVSDIYGTGNVFILIDEDFVLTEENNSAKVCFTNIETIIDDNKYIEEDINETTEILREENDTKEETWVEDVACMETVYSDDIAEDIEISTPLSPKDFTYSDDERLNDDSVSLSDNVSDHMEKVMDIYGGNMCTNDVYLVETLYNTPQMDVNKTLTGIESQTSDELINEMNCNVQNVLNLDNNHDVNDFENRIVACDEFNNRILDDKENLEIDNNLLEDATSQVTLSMHKNKVGSNDVQIGDIKKYDDYNCILNSTEYDGENKKINDFTPNSKYSSSPEVTSTTGEEKNSSILLKITNYQCSRINPINNESSGRKDKISYKLTEKKNYTSYNPNFTSSGTLITKAAQKYIPPLKIKMSDLKVKLPLPEHSLNKLKQLKKSKAQPKIEKIILKPNCKTEKGIKKQKPKFEDVLMSIDQIQYKKLKEKNKKTKEEIPKVVIKKNDVGSHYTSSCSDDRDNNDPDLTGRKWQPWVFIEKNNFIDKMAMKNKVKAMYCRRKNTYVLAEKFKKYKSIYNAKFVISQPKSDDLAKGNLKYTIRLKHN